MVFENTSQNTQAQVMAKVNTQNAGNYDVIAQDPFKHILTVIEKKVRNLEKRKVKLDGYRKLEEEGATLDPDKKAAISKYSEVVGSLDFAKELLKSFNPLYAEVNKTQRKSQLNEQALKEENDVKRSQFVAKALLVLRLLVSNETIQQDFLKSCNNALQLDDSELELLMQFSGSCLMLTSEEGDNALNGADKSGEHLNRLYDGSADSVCGTTYNEIKTVFDKVCDCEYFKSLPNFTEAQQTEDVDEELSETSTSSLDDDDDDDDEIEINAKDSETDELTNENSMANPAVMDATVENVGELNSDDHVTNLTNSNEAEIIASNPTFNQTISKVENPIETHVQQDPSGFMSFQFEDPPVTEVQNHAKKPVHTIEEVLADVQGQYNFLQDSMLDFDVGRVTTTNEQPVHTNIKDQTGNVDHHPPQYHTVNDPIKKESTYLPTRPNASPTEATNQLHHGNAMPNNSYQTPVYVDQENSNSFTTNNLSKPADPQIQQQADNLGMGQTTFGGNAAGYNVEIDNSASTGQYTAALHSMDSYQNAQADMNIIKNIPESTYSTSPFSSLHGNSQPSYEPSLSGNSIPDPIPLPSGQPIAPQSLTTPDPPTTRIPFPNEKISGYRSYNSAPSSTINSSSNPGINQSVEETTNNFVSLQEKQQNPILSAGDSEHVPSSGIKQDLPSGVPNGQAPIKSDPKDPPTSGNRGSLNKTPSSHPNNVQVNRSNRVPQSGYQNAGGYNNNRGGMMPRQQGQNMGGFYSNRGGNYRPSNNRTYGNFDSMGHPKHFSGPGGNYQHSQAGMPPFNYQNNRQDNNMYGGMRRGSGGSGRGNRGYPGRGNMRSGNSNNYNHNRSRSFRPQNSEQAA